jgi:hypothetical protein
MGEHRLRRAVGVVGGDPLVAPARRTAGGDATLLRNTVDIGTVVAAAETQRVARG